MKMYHFDTMEYNKARYTVMAESREQALGFIKQHLALNVGIFGNSNFKYLEWKDSTLDSLPEGYEIEEYGVGSVMLGIGD
jgi:hypothetical protein